MARRSTTSERQGDLKIFGLLPAGITVEMIKTAGRKIQKVIRAKDEGASLTSLQPVPSSLATLEDDALQFVANAAVRTDYDRAGIPATYSRVVDSVITVDRKNGRLRIRGVSVPAFQRSEP